MLMYTAPWIRQTSIAGMTSERKEIITIRKTRPMVIRLTRVISPVKEVAISSMATSMPESAPSSP